VFGQTVESKVRRMDRRFVCRDCGTKWFLPEHRSTEPDLTECGSCGGPLDRFHEGLEGRPPGELDEDPGAG
jgi:hypothetical protein